MIGGVRRLLGRLLRSYEQQGGLSDNLLALVLAVALVSALSTEALGLHLLFGAFVAGAVMPKDPRFVAYLTVKIRIGDNSFVAAAILRVHGTANPDWSGARRGDVALLRSHHRTWQSPER